MKRIVFLLHFAVIALLSGCCKYDDTDIRNQITDINGRLEQLEQLCSRLNTNVDALQSIVNALQQNDYVTSVDPVKEGDDIIGYTITFSKSESITIYHGKDGASGSEGHTPQVGVSKDDDGNYYWTVDGEWLLDGAGQKIRANGTQGEAGASGQDGVTPEFKIEDGYWHVSYDNGTSWEQLGKASGEDGDSMFREVLDGEDSVTFVLADGTELVVPKKTEREISVDVTEIGSSTAVFSGKLVLPSASDKEIYVVYSKDYTMEDGSTVSLRIDDKAVGGRYTVTSGTLDFDTKYYYTYSVKEDGTYSYGEVKSFRTKAALDLSASGTANCYIVSGAGAYSFSAVKGNSMESVGQVASAEVLWESFGTDVAPEVGDLVTKVSFSGEKIFFYTTSPFIEGNALIAVKDVSGTILWSWHIWLVEDDFQEITYANDAGIMMDRNLGATSVTPNDIKTCGLMYQWGRKDPFMGTASYEKELEAKSTTIKTIVETNAETGTVEYTIKNPLTFILGDEEYDDWYYTGDETSNDNLWSTNKTIYDPCPAGWRVPDGGADGIWEKAVQGAKFSYNLKDKGIFLESPYCYPSTWYPKTGGLNGTEDGIITEVHAYTLAWSSTPLQSETDIKRSYQLMLIYINNELSFYNSNSPRSNGLSVRCMKE